MTDRICVRCRQQGKTFPWRPTGAKREQAAVCLDCLNAEDAASRPKSIPFCPSCRRPDSQPHADWCRHYTQPTLPPLDLAAMKANRPTQLRKDAPMPSATIEAALQGLGINTMSAALGNVPDPVADARSVKAPKAKAKAETEPTGRVCRMCPTEIHGKDFLCPTCRAGILAKAQAARATKKAELDAMVAAKQSQAEALRSAVDLLGEPEPVNKTPVSVNSQPDSPASVNEPSRTQTADNSQLPVPSPSPAVPLTPMDDPAAPRPLAELRAERDRVLGQLAQLDQEIEAAEAIEQLAQYSPSDLQAMLETAERQARQLRFALTRKGA